MPRGTSAILTERSLSLSSSAVGTSNTGNPGEGNNGQRAKHTVTFKITGGPTIGSMLVMYCTNPVFISTCTTPTGMTAANLTSANVTGLDESTQAFSLDTTTANGSLSPAANGVCNGATGTTRDNCVALSRTSNVTEGGGTLTVTIEYGGGASDYITNPSTANYSFYARIMVFSDTAYTTMIESGSVAASTAQVITITARVAERLEFSVGATPVVAGTTCAALNDSGALTLGDGNGVLSTAQAYDAWSYFRVNSNTTYGTKIYYSADTLESGANAIDPIAPDTVPDPDEGRVSDTGTEQFGLAIDQSDTDPGGGGENEGYSFTHLSKTAGPYDEGHGTITDGGTAEFALETASLITPIEIASSTTGVRCDTGSVRYMANVATDTPAGIYTTTITYIATGTY